MTKERFQRQNNVMLLLTVSSIIVTCISSFTTKKPIYQQRVISRVDIKKSPIVAPLTANEEDSPSSWGITDDWSTLSSDSYDVSSSDPSSIISFQPESPHHDERYSSNWEMKPDDAFVYDTIDHIYHHGAMYSDPSDPPLYDTESSFESYLNSPSFEDDASLEVNMLVRCNQSPMSLLVDEGRAVAVLSDEEKYDPNQLVNTIGEKGNVDDRYEMTNFFDDAISEIFSEHAVTISIPSSESDNQKGETLQRQTTTTTRALDAAAVAKWMRKCLNEKVGQHDKRVLLTISRYGGYKTGRLTEDEFKKLYFDAVVESLKTTTNDHPGRRGRGRTKTKQMGRKKVEKATIGDVWRDLRAHDILSPAERQHRKLELEHETFMERQRKKASTTDKVLENIMDECEIIEWGSDVSEEGESTRKSSYETVELASDGKTPKRMRDGEFVFIDEESCIGCTQCALAAPSTFTMLNSGRARTFSQNNSPEVKIAVSTCPVNCMHFMSYDELKEMEIARDAGDGRDDHLHMGRSNGYTPLNVAGIDSDANHKSSWYHYLKQKCLMSSNCPQRGCYDCPMFSEKGGNPAFKERQRLAREVRMKDKLNSGELDIFRKFVHL